MEKVDTLLTLSVEQKYNPIHSLSQAEISSNAKRANALSEEKKTQAAEATRLLRRPPNR